MVYKVVGIGQEWLWLTVVDAGWWRERYNEQRREMHRTNFSTCLEDQAGEVGKIQPEFFSHCLLLIFCEAIRLGTTPSNPKHEKTFGPICIQETATACYIREYYATAQRLLQSRERPHNYWFFNTCGALARNVQECLLQTKNSSCRPKMDAPQRKETNPMCLFLMSLSVKDFLRYSFWLCHICICFCAGSRQTNKRLALAL